MSLKFVACMEYYSKHKGKKSQYPFLGIHL